MIEGSYSYEEQYGVLERRHLRIAQHDYGLKISWVENFMTLSMSHENNENWHPTKITCYTVGPCESLHIENSTLSLSRWRKGGDY